jgi:hypothetical protein
MGSELIFGELEDSQTYFNFKNWIFSDWHSKITSKFCTTAIFIKQND